MSAAGEAQRYQQDYQVVVDPYRKVVDPATIDLSAASAIEADPGHVEIAIKEFELEGCKAAATPGSKESTKHDADGEKLTQSDVRRRVQVEIDEAAKTANT